MSGTFLDDVLMQVAQDAYRAAGAISTRTRTSVEESRARLHPNDSHLRAALRRPATQNTANWRVLGPAAAAALAAMPPAGETAPRIISVLNALPAPQAPLPLEPDPEIVALARSFTLAADLVGSSRMRPDFTAAHAETAVSRLAAAVGAVGRVSAAAAACAEPSAPRDRSIALFDSLTAASRLSPRTEQAPVPGFSPAPGSLPDALSKWCAATQKALQPREVDAQIMHAVPADLQYIHSATTLVLGAAITSGTEVRVDAQRADAHLADAQLAWATVVRSWPVEAVAQPGGRPDYEQLLATKNLHESIRDHLREGSHWARPTVIAERLDPQETLRAIADLSSHMSVTAERYVDVTTSLLEHGQIAFPARRVTQPGEQGLDILQQTLRGQWVPLPATDPAATRLKNAALAASLTTSTVEASLRHRSTGDFRDFAQGHTPLVHHPRNKTEQRRHEPPRATGPRL